MAKKVTVVEELVDDLDDGTATSGLVRPRRRRLRDRPLDRERGQAARGPRDLGRARPQGDPRQPLVRAQASGEHRPRPRRGAGLGEEQRRHGQRAGRIPAAVHRTVHHRRQLIHSASSRADHPESGRPVARCPPVKRVFRRLDGHPASGAWRTHAGIRWVTDSLVGWWVHDPFREERHVREVHRPRASGCRPGPRRGPDAQPQLHRDRGTSCSASSMRVRV